MTSILATIATKATTLALTALAALPAATKAPGAGGDIAKPQFVTALESLVRSAANWLSGLALAVGIAMIIYTQIKKMVSDDQNSNSDAKRHLKNVLIACGIVIVASQLIALLQSVFA